MADATLTRTSWGVRATTGTDKTTITTDKVKLYGIHCQGTAGAETVTVTDASSGEVQLIKVVTTTANADYFVDWGGRFVDGLKVTLSASTVSANFLIH